MYFMAAFKIHLIFNERLNKSLASEETKALASYFKKYYSFLNESTGLAIAALKD